MLPRGIRNNNPGNINYVGQPGAVLEPQSPTVPNPRFAKFASMDAGVTALAHQLSLYFSRGINTTDAIIHKWAPPSENNTADYADTVARLIGVPASAPLTCDVQTVSKLVMAISTYECGGRYLPFTIHSILPLVERALAPTMV